MTDHNDDHDKIGKLLDRLMFISEMTSAYNHKPSIYNDGHSKKAATGEPVLVEDFEGVLRLHFFPKWIAELDEIRDMAHVQTFIGIEEMPAEPPDLPILTYRREHGHRFMCKHYFRQV